MGFTSQTAKAAAHSSWAKTTDRTARTRAARDAMWAKVDASVDPRTGDVPA